MPHVPFWVMGSILDLPPLPSKCLGWCAFGLLIYRLFTGPAHRLWRDPWQRGPTQKRVVVPWGVSWALWRDARNHAQSAQGLARYRTGPSWGFGGVTGRPAGAPLPPLSATVGWLLECLYTGCCAFALTHLWRTEEHFSAAVVVNWLLSLLNYFG